MDILKDQSEEIGGSQCLQLGVYLTMSKTQAINATGLLAQGSFILKLMDVNEAPVFNYKDLKAGYTEACNTYHQLKDSFGWPGWLKLL